MAPPSPCPLHTSKLSTVIIYKIPKFKLSFSTSLFPRKLAHVFSDLPSPSATSKEPVPSEEKISARIRNPIPTKCKKARTMARLINAETWTTRLESRLSTLTPLAQTTFFQTLRRIKTPTNAIRFFNWAKDSGFVHTHQSYFMILEVLGRARHLNSARNFLFSIPKKSNNTVLLTDKFFNSLIRSYGDAGLFQESVKVFKAMKSMGISPSAITFNCLFLILFKKGRVGMVFELYDEMLRTYGVKPDLYTFNILIRGFCMNSRVDEAFRMFRDMESFQCEPDLITYNTIVDGLCRAGKVNIARNVVKGMLKKGENVKPNVVSYTTLIRGYCGKQEIDEALDVFKEMIDRGIRPTEITINTIVQGLCESSKFDVIKEILEYSQQRDVRFVPDTCTFNTLINAYCSQENLAEGLEVFEKMKELNVRQDSATYSVLIRALCQKRNFDDAERLLDELFEREILLKDDGCIPVVAAYNPLFEHLCMNGKTKKAERVFRQLMKRGIQDPRAFQTLIMGHCKEEAFENGHKLLVLMLRRDFLPDIEIYESLIEGLLKKELPGIAYDTLQRMLRSSYVPRTSIFHRILMELLKRGFTRESADLVMLMLDKEVRPNINLSTDAVRVLIRSGLQNRAFQLVGSLNENGYVVNMEELIVSLCQDSKFFEACELLVFSLKNDQNVDITICDSVLTGLCKVRMPSQAFRLYYELLEKGIRHPFGCLGDLRDGLESAGKLKEAEFVATRNPN